MKCDICEEGHVDDGRRHEAETVKSYTMNWIEKNKPDLLGIAKKYIDEAWEETCAPFRQDFGDNRAVNELYGYVAEKYRTRSFEDRKL